MQFIIRLQKIPILICLLFGIEKKSNNLKFFKLLNSENLTFSIINFLPSFSFFLLILEIIYHFLTDFFFFFLQL